MQEKATRSQKRDLVQERDLAPRARWARPGHRHARAAGFALVFALFALIAVSLATMVALRNYRTEAQREREADLLFAGEQFRAAIIAYHNRPGAGGKQEYPKSLQDLVLDLRGPVPARHLRRIYRDPLTGLDDWVLDKLGDRIVGVHAPSDAAPVRRAGFAANQGNFAAARRYADWKFAAEGSSAATAAAAAPPVDENPVAPSPGSQAPPAAPINTQQFAQSNSCFENYQVPMGNCSDEPPPFGANDVQCIQHFRALYDACMRGATP